MGSNVPDGEPLKLWIETPLIPSTAMSQAAGCNIFLKLENLQPSGSFKSRGIGHMMLRAISASPDPRSVHFYCSSGGNAGLACATAAVALRRPCTIVVPLSTSAHMVAKLRLLGAEVRQIGANWADADGHLRREVMARDAAGVYVPPFDHADIWEGAGGIVTELVGQLRDLGLPEGRGPDAIVCNCGGGGLLNGIMEGVEKSLFSPSSSTSSSSSAATAGTTSPRRLGQWRQKPRVVAVETVGADSLNASVRAGELVTLPAITSIATSLGAPTVSQRTFEYSKEEHLSSVVVTDAEAVMGSVKLANDARILVEVACGATIATVYNGDLRRTVGKGCSDDEWRRKNVVIVVCGGSNVTLEILGGYQQKYGVP